MNDQKWFNFWIVRILIVLFTSVIGYFVISIRDQVYYSPMNIIYLFLAIFPVIMFLSIIFEGVPKK